MELLTTTIERLKNPSMRCHNVSRPHNNKLIILSGKSIELLRVKSFFIMLSIESPAGNFLIKLRSTKERWKSKKRRNLKLMEASNLKKNCLKNKKKRKKSMRFSRPKALMPTPNGSLVLRCVRTINDGCWWKSVIKRKFSTITLWA